MVRSASGTPPCVICGAPCGASASSTTPEKSRNQSTQRAARNWKTTWTSGTTAPKVTRYLTRKMPPEHCWPSPAIRRATSRITTWQSYSTKQATARRATGASGCLRQIRSGPCCKTVSTWAKCSTKANGCPDATRPSSHRRCSRSASRSAPHAGAEPYGARPGSAPILSLAWHSAPAVASRCAAKPIMPTNATTAIPADHPISATRRWSVPRMLNGRSSSTWRTSNCRTTGVSGSCSSDNWIPRRLKACMTGDAAWKANSNAPVSST